MCGCMNRLIDYLPWLLKDTREMHLIMDIAEQPEVESLWHSVHSAMDEQFIGTAAAYGVRRWEKMLGIVPRGTETLEDRKISILLRLSDSLPYTYKALEQRLAL